MTSDDRNDYVRGQRAAATRLLRPYLLPSGEVTRVLLMVCPCGAARRGPPGGVCGACGGAIPDPSGR